MNTLQGTGFGLKRELIEPLRQAHGAPLLKHVNFVEIAPENWLRSGGRAATQLDWFTAHYQVVCHGLSLSLGGLDPLNIPFLREVKTFLDTYRIPLYTEHLSYCTDVFPTHARSTAADAPQRGYLYDLLPIPFTEASVMHVAKRIRQTQDVLERRIAVENASFYLHSPVSELSELAFIEAVLKEADCDLHLDVNNVYVNSVNFRYDPFAFIDGLKQAGLAERVVYGHIAGHTQVEPHLIIDTHGEPVIETVWQLLAYAYQTLGVFPTLLERDTDVPPLATLIEEVNRIAAIQNAGLPHEHPPLNAVVNA